MYLLQAKDSGTGAMFRWTNASRDGTGYPGPNTATELAVVAQHGAGGSSGIDADGFAYQGDVVLSETLAIPPSGYALVLEIPVTIREGKLHAIAWRCPLHINSGSGVASFLVELFLGTTSGLFESGDVYVSGARQLITWGTADFAWTAGSTGCIPLLGTGSGDTPTPIEPGNYWLKMVVSEVTNTSRGSVNGSAMHRPTLQLLEFNAPPEE